MINYKENSEPRRTFEREREILSVWGAFHTWQRCVRSASCFCGDVQASLYVRTSAKRTIKKGGRERGGEEGGGEAARTNVGDVQVATVANTLGRLRIMMPYCIQIRIPTVVARCVGIWA